MTSGPSSRPPPVHRRDGRVGLRRLGHRLLLPAVLRRLYGGYPMYSPATRPTATAPRTTPGPARMAAARWPTALRRSRRRRALQPADGYVLARRRRLGTLRLGAAGKPTTRGPAPTARRGRVPTSTAAGAARGPARRRVGDTQSRARTAPPATPPATRRVAVAASGQPATGRAAECGVVRTGAATSTPDATATSIATRAAPGRSTTTAGGATPTGRRRSRDPAGSGRRGTAATGPRGDR